MTMSRKPQNDGNKSKTMSTITTAPKERRVCRRKKDGDESKTMSTITTTPKERRAYRRKKNVDESKTMITTTPKKRRVYRRKKCLPHDLIMEEILTKVPTMTLILSAVVSKAWYYSIHIDKRLTHSHFLQSQKEPNLILNLLNVRVGVTNTGKARFSSQFFRVADYGSFQRLASDLSHVARAELVGYCNGFPCTAFLGSYSTYYTIFNPSRGDVLRIIYPVIIGKLISDAHIICHGFGFDSLANEYKLVSIYSTSQNQFNIIVFSLGTKSWRNITASSAPISYHGRPIVQIRAAANSDKSAIFCSSSTGSSTGGCLVWKMVTTIQGGEGANGNNSNSNIEMEMLLSFNLHEEKFQFIQLPAKSTTNEQENQFLVDYPHLLEFKGSPCIARLEKRLGIGSDFYHRQSHDHQGSSCCCCCKIHLYVLKDKAKWVKDENFDVRMKSTCSFSHVVPDPCCFCFGSTLTPFTRIFSFSNQILLYWFDGEHLQIYNLRSEKLKIVIPRFALERDIFLAKMKEPLDILDDGDDSIYCSKMDYQLHLQGENFISLQTFVPEGVAGIDADAFHKLASKTNHCPYSAYVFVNKGSGEFYPFLN